LFSTIIAPKLGLSNGATQDDITGRSTSSVSVLVSHVVSTDVVAALVKECTNLPTKCMEVMSAKMLKQAQAKLEACKGIPPLYRHTGRPVGVVSVVWLVWFGLCGLACVVWRIDV
jgi:hypothetical protein